MKNGIVKENGILIYYKNDAPCHAGAIKIDGKIYYAGRGGVIATGQHVVHGDMSNSVLKHGTYIFDENGVVKKESYRPPQRVSTTEISKKRRRRKPHTSRKKKVIILASIALIIAMFIGIAMLADKLTSRHTSTDHSKEKGHFSLPTFSEAVNLSDPLVQKLITGEATMLQVRHADPYKPFVFNYLLDNTDAELFISENQGMTSVKSYTLPKSESTLIIDNLKTGTTYYYRVDIGKESHTGKFTTAEGTRFIYIPGVYNTRDIGACTTADGKKLKQGMIIRGSEMDGLIESSYYLSKNDVNSVRDQFSFSYDMDLRDHSTYTGYYISPLGSGVRHDFYSAPTADMLFDSGNADEIKNIFKSFAKEENYPMYLHCTDGADRTGTVVYLLQGLLGCSDETLSTEYRMSGFFSPEYSDSPNPDKIMEGLSAFDGTTTSQKIENFLISAGVTKTEINSIRTLLLEG